MQRLPALPTLLAAALGLALGVPTSAGPAVPRAEADPVDAVSAHEALIRALRSQRDPEAPPARALFEGLATPDGPLVDLAFRLLRERRVPALAEDEAPQALSEVQEELLLLVVEAGGRELVLARVGAGGALAQDLPARRIALLALGATGRAQDLQTLFALALRRGEEELPRPLFGVLSRALAALLARAPDAHGEVARAFDDLHGDLRVEVLRALGETGSPLALPLLVDVLHTRPELQALTLAQIAGLGPSHDFELNRALEDELLDLLDDGERATARAATVALGALESSRAVEHLIALLDHEDGGLRENALWALRRATRLQLPAEGALWRAWYGREAAWFDEHYTDALRALASQDEVDVLEALHTLSKRSLRRWEVALDLEPLVTGHHSPVVRAAAIDALARLGCPGLVGSFEAALDDTDDRVHTAACRALEALGRTPEQRT